MNFCQLENYFKILERLKRDYRVSGCSLNSCLRIFTHEAHWASIPSTAKIIAFPRQANVGVPWVPPPLCLPGPGKAIPISAKYSRDKNHLGFQQPPPASPSTPSEPPALSLSQPVLPWHPPPLPNPLSDTAQIRTLSC